MSPLRDKVRNPAAAEMKLSVKPFSKGLRSLEAEPQVAARKSRNSPFDSGLLTGINQNKKKSATRKSRNLLERPSFRTVFPFWLFELIPGSDTGNQKGIPPVATGGSGLCPENPQPFEKGWRKL